MYSIRICYLFLTLFFVPFAHADRQLTPTAKTHSQGENTASYYALVIGINAYRHIDKLQTATNDAKTIAGLLDQKYGFITRLVLDQDATREKIMNELNEFRAKLKPDDKLLIYYAGHGVYEKDTDASFWLPVDAKRDNDANWIDAKNITDQLTRIAARHVLIVADSCYSGTMTRNLEPVLKTPDVRHSFLKKMQSKKARVIISSGGNEPVTDSGGRGHSIFAEVFINALTKPDNDIFTAEELYGKHIKELVAGRAEQTPEYKIIRKSGHEGGDFIFRLKNAVDDIEVEPQMKQASIPENKQPEYPARPAVTTEMDEEEKPPNTISVKIKNPKNAILVLNNKSYDLNNEPIVNFHFGNTPFSLYLNDRKQTVYGLFEVKIVDETTKAWLFGLEKDKALFKEQHIERALLGQPVFYGMRTNTDRGLNEVFMYKLSLQKIK